jgi:hypothetical protein
MKEQEPCGWDGTVQEFLEESWENLQLSLINHHLRCMQQQASSSQIQAWKSSHNTLVQALSLTTKNNPALLDIGIVFEYELPRERGRRPDVVLLSGSNAAVLEFKDTQDYSQAFIDQVDSYVRDLKNYHAASHELIVKPILVMAHAEKPTTLKDNVTIVSGKFLSTILDTIFSNDTSKPSLQEWIHSDYDPLPNIVNAARILFKHEPLPFIKRARSAGIPDTIKSLIDIAKQAQNNKEHHLALVTGVPGAGKTLAGLQLVYNDYFATYNHKITVFLSGNGPLVQVLQHALRNTVFVQDVHGFLKQYGGNSQRIPVERIWVYDEAQRAWDSVRVQEKRGHNASEPEDFLKIGERISDWALMVGLVGEGQEIHLGEEAGLVQWNEAISKMHRKWIVHCPERIAPLFSTAEKVNINPSLDLTVSLRSHLAEDVQTWVACLLEGNLEKAGLLSNRISEQGFDIYFTHDLEQAKDYVRSRYLGNLDNRYGLIASSKAKDLPKYGIKNDYFSTQRVHPGPWYNSDPSDQNSCCILETVVTEFGCQGLELDFPIVCWGNDLIWDGKAWQTPKETRSSAHDPHKLRINSYRVLLTRGRDGFIIYIPKVDGNFLTIEALKKAGIKELLN